MKKYTPAELKKKILLVPGWRAERNALARTVSFYDFKEAMVFVEEVSELAVEYNHHPEMTIQFNKVMLRLRTRSVGGVTSADVKLAGLISELL
ncbi:MAG: 4a-hydroxytetrahydrobiopterin dehydratase [Nanoarchaeota archaeon]|nr:4a-hydroxytetrahydrobiopterin dehydratase [Nanoarchaeota archaeon]